MLVHALIVAALLVGVMAAVYAVHALRGSTPPELEDEGKPLPDDRDETWDPHERYDQAGRA